MTISSRTGILGGTFDPIHLGHLALADAARTAFSLDRVLLLPSRVPPHRPQQPSASLFHRFAMAAVAAVDHPGLVVSDVEVLRDGPSYTVDTLRSLQAGGQTPDSLFFLIGTDAFAEIASWRGFPGVLDLAHFVVCSRPGTPAPVVPLHAIEVASRIVERLDLSALSAERPTKPSAATRIVLFDAGTPAVSSTLIRASARAGRPLAGLVPPAVDVYIRRHGLYGAPPDPDAGASARGRQLA